MVEMVFHYSNMTDPHRKDRPAGDMRAGEANRVRHKGINQCASDNIAVSRARWDVKSGMGLKARSLYTIKSCQVAF